MLGADEGRCNECSAHARASVPSVGASDECNSLRCAHHVQYGEICEQTQVSEAICVHSGSRRTNL